MTVINMMSFVREHKWLMVLIALSLIVILAGVIVLQVSDKKIQQEQEQFERLNNIASQAAQELVETVAHAEQPIEDIIPESSLEKVKAMEGRIPETGTEDWCELMMTKNADTWTQEEQSQFAQHCI
jgi:type II secretory pathway pseudopilin PulG